MTATRRLTSIRAADVAGYSRLMGGDEEGPHGRLRAHFRKLIEPKTAAGRCAAMSNTDNLAQLSNLASLQRGNRVRTGSYLAGESLKRFIDEKTRDFHTGPSRCSAPGYPGSNFIRQVNFSAKCEVLHTYG
jgi:hypothetical protein